MSLPGSHHRFNEGSYAPYQTDMRTGYVGEVQDARRHTGTVDTVHIREQTQAPRDLIEDGAEGGGPLEDGAGQVPGTGHQHLYEAGGIMLSSIYTLCGIIAVTGIVMGTIVGVLWLLGVSL